MARVTIEIPTSLHRSVKSFVGAKGDTMKEFFIEAAEEKLSREFGINIKKEGNEYLTEEEADKMLEPYLIEMVSKIKNNEMESYSWDEIKKKLDNEDK